MPSVSCCTYHTILPFKPLRPFHPNLASQLLQSVRQNQRLQDTLSRSNSAHTELPQPPPPQQQQHRPISPTDAHMHRRREGHGLTLAAPLAPNNASPLRPADLLLPSGSSPWPGQQTTAEGGPNSVGGGLRDRGQESSGDGIGGRDTGVYAAAADRLRHRIDAVLASGPPTPSSSPFPLPSSATPGMLPAGAYHSAAHTASYTTRSPLRLQQLQDQGGSVDNRSVTDSLQTEHQADGCSSMDAMSALRAKIAAQKTLLARLNALH